ncbi:MAG: hypothetical protein HY960_01025 [Ignavibacteriae bacterium]|nr:hypothetical protein [Ignavibacteriota bacterium]
MAKAEQKKIKSSKSIIFPLEKQNYIILAIGLIVIIVGYFALASNGVEGFMPLVVAPILLVLGYCVIIPFGILYKVKEKQDVATTQS